MADGGKESPEGENVPLLSSEENPHGYVHDDFDPFHGVVECTDENIDIQLTAPPENQWYHGRLDRYTSENRLQKARHKESKHGFYLIRESDRKPGNYVLSFLGKEGLSHFRITAVCGAYYIGGREFNSLSDLIGYYTSYSDLLKDERLAIPVSPPEPVYHKRKIVAILPYSQVPDTDELSFEKGEIFVVHNDMGDGWLWVTSQMTQCSGIINEQLIQELNGNVDPVIANDWFWSDITKDQAAEKLGQSGPGSFLVRPSDSEPSNFTLFFYPKVNDRIQRFKILKKEQYYSMGNRFFNSIADIIERYKKEEILLGCTLKVPVKKGVDGSLKDDEAIYASMKQSSGSNFILNRKDAIDIKGWLDKKSQKAKKWKNMYFVLNATEQQIYYFENEKRSKPKGLIDLSLTSLYPVHLSFFERPHCFQLITQYLSQTQVYYLCADDADSAQEWQEALKPYCMNTQPPDRGYKQPYYPTATTLRSLYITIHDARRLSTKHVPHPYCIVSLGDAKVARTSVKTSPDACWDEDIVIEDIPLDVTTMSIAVFSKNKRSKDCEIYKTKVSFIKDLTPCKVLDKWFQLNPTSLASKCENGSIRAKVNYVHEMIMPQQEYKTLKSLVGSNDFTTICVLEQVCSNDLSSLAQALLQIFRYQGQEALLLKEVTALQIRKEDSPSQLFRSNSLATTLMDQYMKTSCAAFVLAAVQPTVTRIIENKQPCEIDHTEGGGDMETNTKNLLDILSETVNTIFSSLTSCPTILRYICSNLQEMVATRWPDEPMVKLRVVSGFIFLRLLCPAIITPKKYSLITEAPSVDSMRTLKMVARYLQKLANLSDAKDSHLDAITPFLRDNKQRMISFLTELASVTDCPQSNDKSKVDIARALATVHQICSTHLDELSELTSDNPTIRGLVTATSLLNCHKRHYNDQSVIKIQ